MILEWNAGLATGLAWQDAQHQELFKRVNSLLDAMNAGHGVTTLGEVFSFLENYVMRHFGEEERFMKLHRLGGFEEHKAAHEDFVLQYAALKSALMNGNGSAPVCLKLQTMLSGWLISHIGETDRRLAEQTAALARR